MDDLDEAPTGNLSDWMKVWWLICAPFALLLAGRVGWEKTVWTWTRGPQIAGFSLWHLHPLFAIAGLLSFWGILVWSVLAVVFVAVRRQRIPAREIGMFLCAVFVMLAMMLPDTFFA
jgi:hypothetical protein